MRWLSRLLRWNDRRKNPPPYRHVSQELYEVEKTVKAGVLVVTRKGREEAAGNDKLAEFKQKYMKGESI